MLESARGKVIAAVIAVALLFLLILSFFMRDDSKTASEMTPESNSYTSSADPASSGSTEVDSSTDDSSSTDPTKDVVPSLDSGPTSPPVEKDGGAQDEVGANPTASVSTDDEDYTERMPGTQAFIKDTKPGNDKSKVPTYTSKNYKDFSLKKAKDYKQSVEPSSLSDESKSQWIPQVTGFANNYFKLFTDQDRATWLTRINPYVSPKTAIAIASASPENLEPTMPESAELAKVGDNFVTVRYHMNNNSVILISSSQVDGKWVVDFFTRES